MSWWNAKYKNNCGEYEITFGSKEYEKTKAVEKVCCAVMDETVNTPDDIEIVVHGKWVLKHIGHGHYWECSVCRTNPCIYVTKNTKFCPNCGAKMDLE